MSTSTIITSIDQLDLNKCYTYQDYLSWQFDELVELIRGKIVRMSPAPNRRHQEVSGALFLTIGNYLVDKSCKVYYAPFDVRLPVGENETVVQPDLCVVCDLEKLDHRGCNGAPDWIIEILSSSTSKKDLTEKFDLYQEAGVQEYWIVHPSEATIIPYRLSADGAYQALRITPFFIGESIPVGVFEGLEVELGRVFG